MFQQPLSDRRRHAPLGQQESEGLSQVMAFQFRQANKLSGSLPLLWAESVCEQSLLPIRKRSDMIGQFRHHPFGNRPLRHGLTCLAIPSCDGIAVEANVADANGLDIAASETCRHSQKDPQAQWDELRHAAAVVVQLAFWVEQAGQSQMLGPLLVAVVARELSPVLIGIVVIVRSGSAMVTELGIMRTDGCVDALEAKELSPFLCLVMPRVLATAVSTFCLTIVFILVAFASGYLVGAMVGTGNRDLLLLMDTVSRAVHPKDVLAIVSKSIVPALFAGASCCIGGLDVGESLTEVPQATQRALVRSLVGLFVISTVVSFLTYL